MGEIAAKAVIACIIAFIISRINEKYTFKETFPKALLAFCSFSLLMGLFRLTLYDNSDYPYNYPPNYLDRIITNIILNISCIGISLAIIYTRPKPKENKFMGMDQSITYYLNLFELTAQKLTQQKENFKNALQSELISQNEYEEKLKQIETKIEKEHQITERIKEHQTKVEKLKSFEQKKEDLLKLYSNQVLVHSEYTAKLEELKKEEFLGLKEIHNDWGNIKIMINQYLKMK